MTIEGYTAMGPGQSAALAAPADAVARPADTFEDNLARLQQDKSAAAMSRAALVEGRRQWLKRVESSPEAQSLRAKLRAGGRATGVELRLPLGHDLVITAKGLRRSRESKTSELRLFVTCPEYTAERLHRTRTISRLQLSEQDCAGVEDQLRRYDADADLPSKVERLGADEWGRGAKAAWVIACIATGVAPMVLAECLFVDLHRHHARKAGQKPF